MRFLRFVSIPVLGAVLFARPALATLTDSEKAIVRTFIEKGALDSAGRVRSLAARPDLTPAEVAEALRGGYATAPFDDTHRRFTEALLFGQGSSASRNALVPAVVEGLLGRAAARMADVPLDATTHTDRAGREAADEIVAIHAFIDARIANAGTPPADGHDPSAAIRDDALQAAALSYKAHLEAHARWFRMSGRASTELVRVRTQVEATLVDLGRGIQTPSELSQWLGLAGTRRSVFARHGVLIETDDTSKDALLVGPAALLEATPRTTEGLSVWLLSRTSAEGLVARGKIERVPVTLSDTKRPTPSDALWPEDVKPSHPDATLVELAGSVARLATSRTLATDPAVSAWARKAADHAARAGAPGLLAVDVARLPAGQRTPAIADPEHVVAGAVKLLLVDAPLTVDLALIRGDQRHPETLEQLSVALAVLASGRPRLTLGAAKDDGSVAPIELTDLVVDHGAATRFTLAGKHYQLVPDDDGDFTVSIDGKPPKLTSLASFVERTQAGDSWDVGGTEYQRISGAPRAAAFDDGRFVVEGGTGSFDAIATGAAANDGEISALFKPSGEGGGVVLRAASTDTGYTGIGLVLGMEPAEARLLAFDGHGKAAELAGPLALPPVPADGYPVSLAISGDKITATVGGRSLTAKVPADFGPGKAAIVVRAKSRVDLRRLKIVAKVTP